MEKETFEEIYDKVAELNRNLREECYKYLRRALNRNNGKVVISASDEDDEDPTYVTYDGGRHPEYDTNPYSRVHSVYLSSKKEDKIYLSIDECDEYEIGRVYSIDELVDVCMSVKAVLP